MEYIDPKELHNENYILPSESTDTYQRVNSALASSNLSLLQLDAFLTFSNEEAIVMSVQKGLGVSFSSNLITSTLGGVKTIPIKGIEIRRSISIVRDKSQLSTGARDAFWQFMTSISDKIKNSVKS
jgi:DNA-binding transcriptional LysR family regulator